MLSAADPLNLVGILVPGERIPAISGKTVVFRDGVAVSETDAPDSPRLTAMGDRRFRRRLGTVLENQFSVVSFLL